MSKSKLQLKSKRQFRMELINNNDYPNDFKFVHLRVFRYSSTFFPIRQTKIESDRNLSNKINRSIDEITLITKKTEKFSEKESIFKIKKKK